MKSLNHHSPTLTAGMLLLVVLCGVVRYCIVWCNAGAQPHPWLQLPGGVLA